MYTKYIGDGNAECCIKRSVWNNVLQTCYDNIYYAHYIYKSFNDRGKLIKNMIISLILPCIIGKH